MTKTEEKSLLKTIEDLKKQMLELQLKFENNQLSKCVYSVMEVAKMLGVTKQAVYAMIERNELETVKLGTTKIKGSSLREKII